MKLNLTLKKKTEVVDIVREAKYSHFIASVLQFLAGISLTIFSNMSNNTMHIILAAMCILVGGTKLFGYFCNDLYRLAFQFDMAVGIFVALFGILLLISPESIGTNLPNIVGLYIILDGVFKFQIAFDAKRFGLNFWIALMITAVAVGATGVVVFLEPIETVKAEIILMGIALALDGAENAWVTMATVKVRVKKKNVEEKYENFYN